MDVVCSIGVCCFDVMTVVVIVMIGLGSSWVGAAF